MPRGKPVGCKNKVRQERHYSAWYTDEAVEEISRVYLADIENFGFQFDRVEPYDPVLDMHGFSVDKQ